MICLHTDQAPIWQKCTSDWIAGELLPLINLGTKKGPFIIGCLNTCSGWGGDQTWLERSLHNAQPTNKQTNKPKKLVQAKEETKQNLGSSKKKLAQEVGIGDQQTNKQTRNKQTDKQKLKPETSRQDKQAAIGTYLGDEGMGADWARTLLVKANHRKRHKRPHAGKQTNKRTNKETSRPGTSRQKN